MRHGWYKKYLLLVVGCMLCWSGNILGDISQAESAYKKGDYTKALSLYQAVEASNQDNPYFAFNIATTYAKLDYLGKALFWYTQTQKKLPRDADTLKNIAIVHDKVIDKIENQSVNLPLAVSQFLTPITLMEASILFVLALLCLGGIKAIALFKKPLPMMMVPKTVVFLLVVILGSVVVTKYGVVHYSDRGVIIDKKVAVKSGPSDTLSTLYFLHDGVMFVQTKTVDNWIKIQLSNGLSGWIKESTYWRL